MQGNQAVTIRAVIRYAADLRHEGTRIVIRDVWAKPYMPAESYARKLCAQHGPEGAIAYLRGRAAQAQREEREREEQNRRTLERHKARQRQALADEDTRRSRYKLGTRLELALAELRAVASPSAASLDSGVSGGDPDYMPLTVNKRGVTVRKATAAVDMGDIWQKKALAFVRDVERAVFQAKTRDLTDRAA